MSYVAERLIHHFDMLLKKKNIHHIFMCFCSQPWQSRQFRPRFQNLIKTFYLLRLFSYFRYSLGVGDIITLTSPPRDPYFLQFTLGKFVVRSNFTDEYAFQNFGSCAQQSSNASHRNDHIEDGNSRVASGAAIPSTPWYSYSFRSISQSKSDIDSINTLI